jgi:hypothetical protein
MVKNRKIYLLKSILSSGTVSNNIIAEIFKRLVVPQSFVPKDITHNFSIGFGSFKILMFFFWFKEAFGRHECFVLLASRY